MQKFLGCLLLLCGAAWLRAIPAYADVGALDGRVFIGSIHTPSQQRAERYALTFYDGRFCSTGCAKNGYSESAYEATRETKGIHFEANTHAKSGVTAVWKGFVEGSVVHATAAISELNGTSKRISFSGTERKVRAPKISKKSRRKRKK